MGKLVGEGRFDLVLTDIQMPAADGFTVLKTVHEVDPALPVVAVSARGELDAADFREKGFVGCLRKPFTSGELLAAIRAACDEGPDSGEPGCSGGSGAADTPQPDRVDFSALTAYAGDDAEAARSILHSFAEQTAANCNDLEKALDAEDEAAVKALAHKMIPIFTMLGAREVAEVLRRAENRDEAAVGVQTAALRSVIGKIRAIVAEAEKKLTL